MPTRFQSQPSGPGPGHLLPGATAPPIVMWEDWSPFSCHLPRHYILTSLFLLRQSPTSSLIPKAPETLPQPKTGRQESGTVSFLEELQQWPRLCSGWAKTLQKKPREEGERKSTGESQGGDGRSEHRARHRAQPVGPTDRVWAARGMKGEVV
jgi:hypothetical protein